MGAFRTFAKRFPLLVGLVMFVVLWCCIYYIPSPLGGSDLGWAIKEFFLMLFAGILAILFIGISPFRPSAKGFRYALKESAYYLVVNVGALGLFAFINSVVTNLNADISADYFQSFLLALVLAICIGILEELVFRVFLFEGLVAKMGSTHAGLIGAAVISSLIFGFAHVVSSLFGDVTFTVDYVLQILGKTAQAGIMGFLLCAVYVKTRNFWCIAGIHMLSDFFGLWMSFASNADTGTFVGSDAGSWLLYFLVAAINIPVIITSVKMLKSAALPQEGPLVSDDYLPCTPPDEPKKKRRSKKKQVSS